MHLTLTLKPRTTTPLYTLITFLGLKFHPGPGEFQSKIFHFLKNSFSILSHFHPLVYRCIPIDQNRCFPSAQVPSKDA